MNAQVPDKIPFFRDPSKLSVFYQIMTLLGVVLLSYYLVSNTLANLERQSISTGFDFLGKEAAFEIGESLIDYSAADSYGRALIVGFLNTLIVSFIGITLTVLLGTVIGIARLSSNWLVAKLSAIYIEVFQDIPVLLQLFFWYAFFYEILPTPRQALAPLPGVFLCNRGLIFGVPHFHLAYIYAAIAFGAGIICVIFITRWSHKRQDESGKIFPLIRVSAVILVGAPLLAWLLGGAPAEMNVPALKGFNFKGGVTISPEFTALLLGLVLYTAAFVAEVVRAGIQSVSKGQREAAMSIGLKPAHVLNLVILPQALRVIVPPLTSQMLNLTKNSSLAVAIGYPDFVSVAGTTINQTGQAIEGVALIMIVYLIFSLSTSAYMNWYNKRIALVER
ncbi:amino acid ABC transporter permease [Desulforhopalus singaporensis]|uniref:Amino acid ABC transporter membrane protein 1, PAAT family (TC 3.A.1.3.-) n=1 Tax=Desulforhopalus singaporensis TaxID=91360 RepID=A0A1H0J3E9_9BACT|nr:amino acid ABC transporter permease [Desulforhopalus singaporensis]SDO38132.1 amino acid ABC transporter membrane protein 1, PAAT family (TC 3.A.1.3.-) [Desulforhopalus singaporensis]